MYVTSETFTNELITRFRWTSFWSFASGYRNVDVLLIDDVQFIAKKAVRAGGVFFNTFNTLHNATN